MKSRFFNVKGFNPLANKNFIERAPETIVKLEKDKMKKLEKELSAKNVSE